MERPDSALSRPADSLTFATMSCPGRVRRPGVQHHFRFIVPVLIGVIAVAGPRLNAAGPAGRVVVDAPASVAKQFSTIGQAVERADWEYAVTRLLSLMDSSPDTFIEVESGRFVRCLDWGNQLIARFPEKGLATYRARVDARAASEFESAAAEEDDRKLRDVVDRFPHATTGAQSMMRLARQAWLEGDIEQARQIWERLLGMTSAGLSADVRTEILSSLILCSVAEHDLDRARSELDDFRMRFPRSEGRIGNVHGLLAELLSDEIESASDRVLPLRRSFFADPLTARTPSIESFGTLVWSRDLDSNSDTTDSAGAATTVRDVLLPVTDDRNLFLTGVERIRGLRLADGGPAWPTGQTDDDGTLFQGRPPRDLDLNQVGLPTLTATLNKGLLFAVPGRCVDSAPREILPLLTPRVVALDIGGGEGRLIWSQGLEGTLSQEGWMPAGAPIAERDRLWLPVHRSEAPFDVGLARLKAADGSLDWVQPIGSALADESRNAIRYDDCWISEYADQVYLLSPSGMIAAISAEEAHVRWISTFEAGDLSERDLNSGNRNRSSPPQFIRGMVVAAPRGAGEVLAWNAHTGEPAWKSDLKERGLQVCGVSEEHVIVAGRRLTALDATTGRPVWRFGFEDEDGAGAGPAAVSGAAVVWSTRSDLFLLNASSGTILDRLSLRDRYGLSGGQLLIAGDRLIIATPDRIAALRVTIEGQSR